MAMATTAQTGEKPAEAGTGPFVTYDVRDGVAWVMLDRPQYSNAQNYRLLNELDDCFRKAIDDEAVKVIVLGGNGKHFSAGHDMGTPEKDSHLDRERRDLWWSHTELGGAERQYVLEQDAYLGLCRRWAAMPKPAIAMVQGACIAGGLMLAWVCDMIVASDDAFFQDPVLRMNQPGVEYFAHPFELPPRIAREFLYLGQRMPAPRAYELGMINRVVPRDQLRDEVAKIAAEIAERPRLGLALTKQAINLVEDLRGKRTSMDAVFHMHHFAHAQNQLTTGNLVGNFDAKAMAAANKAQAEKKK
jgi:enoyl-CoA hydratase